MIRLQSFEADHSVTTMRLDAERVRCMPIPDRAFRMKVPEAYERRDLRSFVKSKSTEQ